MEKKSRLRRVKIFVAIVIILIVMPIAIYNVVSAINDNRFDRWSTQFEDIQTPENSIILYSEKSNEDVNTGNDDGNYYGYCIVLESDLSQEDLTPYYQPYLQEANLDYKGIENLLEVKQVIDKKGSPSFRFYGLDTFLSTYSYSDRDCYVVYFIKPGRFWLWN